MTKIIKAINNSTQDSNFQIITAPGTFCTQGARISLYCANRPIATPHGEVIQYKGKNNIDIFPDPFISTKEPVFVDTQPFNSFYSYFNPIKVFTNGMLRAINWYNEVEISPSQYSNPSPSMKSYTIKVSHTNLGQENDIKHFHEVVLEWNDKNRDKNKKAGLHAYSAGCGALMGALKEYGHTPEYANVAFVVLEAPYFSIEHSLSQYLYFPFYKMFNYTLTFFTQYRSDGHAPGDNLHKCPKHIPFIIITSDKDEIIHRTSAKKLAKALLLNGNTVYFLKLEGARHHNYPLSEKRKLIEYLVQAFYEENGLTPYIKESAEKGRELLQKCRLKPTFVNDKSNSGYESENQHFHLKRK